MIAQHPPALNERGPEPGVGGIVTTGGVSAPTIDAGSVADGDETDVAVRVEHVTRRYRNQIAVDDVSFTLRRNSITGLLGRNGAGKSTLLRLITAQEYASQGRIEVFGASPVENRNIQRRMVLVREDQAYPDFRVRHALAAASWCYPRWSAELAAGLLDAFELPTNRQIKKLSRGMRSAVGIVIGLASRAELTLLDEPYAGLDPVARQMFYDQLLADYAEHPRTILLSTHLVDEIADLLEHVLLIDHGQITMDAPADEVRGRAVTVSGLREAVTEFTAGHSVWHATGLGPHARVTIGGPLSDSDRSRARSVGLELEPVSLQQLLVHSSGQRTEGDQR